MLLRQVRSQADLREVCIAHAEGGGCPACGVATEREPGRPPRCPCCRLEVTVGLDGSGDPVIRCYPGHQAAACQHWREALSPGFVHPRARPLPPVSRWQTWRPRQ
jgi:hypothetical protein